MKTVILMRHAKSSWADPGMDDHERRLNKRGRIAAAVMARWLADQRLVPDCLLCSSARRARETAERMRAALPSLPEPAIAEVLYHATPGAILERLRRLPEACRSVLVIGHEPGLGQLLARLAPGATAPGLARAYAHFPTAAVAVLEADVADWRGIGAGAMRLTDFAVPRELMA